MAARQTAVKTPTEDKTVFRPLENPQTSQVSEMEQIQPNNHNEKWRHNFKLFKISK